MRETKFSLDTLGNQVFDGYTRDEDWNGWACPYFTFEQAERIVEACRASGISARYDAALDAFNFELESGAGEKEVETYPAQEIEGRKVYSVGAFCWIWDEETVKA